MEERLIGELEEVIDKTQVQSMLERSAIKRNGGMCETYSYCKFCKEPTVMCRESDTPCADAFVDMKRVNQMLKNYYSNIEYVNAGQFRIQIWEETFNERYYDEEYLAEWYGELKKEDTFGMPKAKGMYISPVEVQAQKRNNIREKIKDFIQKEKDRVNGVKTEVEILKQVFITFNEKDKFILDLILDKYTIANIIVSYEKMYGKSYSEKAMKNKVGVIKKKIWKKFKEIKKSTLFSEKAMV